MSFAPADIPPSTSAPWPPWPAAGGSDLPVPPPLAPEESASASESDSDSAADGDADGDGDGDGDNADDDDEGGNDASRKRKRPSVPDKRDARSSGEKPAKQKRSQRACLHCRRLKMRCLGAENGPPCARCKASGHACIFEESNRGRKGTKSQRTEAMAQSLRKMEQTLATVLQSLRTSNTTLPPHVLSQLQGMPGHPALFQPHAPPPPPPPHAGAASLVDSAAAAAAAAAAVAAASAQAQHHAQHQAQQQAQQQAQHQAQQQARQPTQPPWVSTEAVPPPPEHASAAHMPAEGFGALPPQAFQPPRPIASAMHKRPRSGTAPRHPDLRFAEPMPHLHSPPTDDASNHSSIPARTPVPPVHTGESTDRKASLKERVNVYHPADGESAPSSPKASTVGRFRTSSPRLHALPDNTLNPLGLLAEASLHNAQRARRKSRATPGSATGSGSNPPASVSDGPSNSPRDSTNGTGEKPPEEAKEAGADAQPLGVANSTYFKPSAMSILPLRRIVIEREMPPAILQDGVVNSEEVVELFRIFFVHCMQYAFLLDPDWHTPTFVCARSPFLFTAILAVASRFYTPRPELYAKTLGYAKQCAFTSLEHGFKSVEIVQAFLLLALWGEPSVRFEQDTAWMFSGMAIRMATDLNLDRKSLPPQEGDDPEREREILNRERTWYVCFTIDRGFASQMGKAYSVREDWLIRNSRPWCMQRRSRPWDVGISGLVELQRIQSRQMDFLYSSTTSVSGLNVDIDYPSVLRIFNQQLEEWIEVWRFDDLMQDYRVLQRGQPEENGGGEGEGEGAKSGTKPQDTKGKAPEPKEGEEQAPDSLDDAITEAHYILRLLGEETDVDADAPRENADYIQRALYFLIRQGPVRYHYAVLFLNSFGLQHALDHPTRTGLDKPAYFSRCFQAATGIIKAACLLGRHLRYAPDSQYVMIAYACVFLLKLLQPAFASYSDEDLLLDLVGHMANFLQSLAVSTTHTPYLYSSFLRALVQAHFDRTQSSRSNTTTPHRSRAASPSDPTTKRNTGVNAVSIAAAVAAAQSRTSRPPTRPASRMTSRVGSPTMQPAAAAQFMMGFPLMPGGREEEEQPDQMLSETFWSSFLPPGFGGAWDATTPGLPQDNPFSFPSGGMAGAGGRWLRTPGHTPGATPGITQPSTPNLSFTPAEHPDGHLPFAN